MKLLALAITLASLMTLRADTEVARRARDCPVVSVSCLDTVRVGEPLTFTASIVGADPESRPTFKWTVSAGTIQSGQDTSSIVVDTTGAPYNSTLTATVDVTGLPEPCDSSASCSTGLVGIRDPHDKIDEYGNIKFEDEMARLDNFAIELLNWPDGVGYIVAYGGRRSRRGEALKRAERAKVYVTNVRGIPSAQVVTMDGGYKEDLTVELRIRSKEMQPPTPTPTVDPSEVRFIKSGPKAGARRRRNTRRARPDLRPRDAH
jgi:hypothetical protein